MDFLSGGLKKSVLKAVIAVIIAAPLTYIGLDYYAALTVSVDPGNIVYTMATGGAIISGLLAGLSAFLSSYIRVEN
ncbi:hypothetical protein ACK3SF_01495 [Candidatus Nanosalina sp. VS9-1]|uniref:hypothetical protein n=1 Tax=Candidatus Nanosalina sp. VS9-1 TaxID=3388566 RepID=UPI0039E0C516